MLQEWRELVQYKTSGGSFGSLCLVCSKRDTQKTGYVLMRGHEGTRNTGESSVGGPNKEVMENQDFTIRHQLQVTACTLEGQTRSTITQTTPPSGSGTRQTIQFMAEANKDPPKNTRIFVNACKYLPPNIMKTHNPPTPNTQ